jgi:hypothetical protein
MTMMIIIIMGYECKRGIFWEVGISGGAEEGERKGY